MFDMTIPLEYGQERKKQVADAITLMAESLSRIADVLEKEADNGT